MLPLHTHTLTSNIIASKDIKWRELKFLQQDDFKELSDIDRKKLKNSLLANNFIQPFYVWEDTDGIQYCLDGKHRTLLLEELILEGITVPELLPGLFINCENKQQASKLVLVFSSAYARVTQEGFSDFVSLYELNIPELLGEISIPSLVIEDLMPLPIDLEGEPKNKPATMKITFSTAAELEAAMPLIDTILKTKFTKAFFSVSSGEI